MRILLIIGTYLIAIDTIGSYISEIILNKKYTYLNNFFEIRDQNKYLLAGWSTIIIGKTPMTATGRAAIGAGFISGGVFLYNGHLQRAHEISQAALWRAYDKSYFRKGPKPVWSNSK